MKKLIVMGIICLMITGLSVAANAYAGVTLNVAPVADGGSFQTVQLGWLSDDGTGAATTNGKDASVDGANGLTAMAGQVEMDILNSGIASSKVNGDWRAPIAAATDTQVWRLKVTMPTYPVDESDMTVYSAVSFGLTAGFTPGLGLPANAKLYILNGSFTTAAAAKAAVSTSALLWTAPLGDGGVYNSAANAFTIPSPTYDADNDMWITSGAYKYFTVYAEGQTVAQTPEPGSMVAMLSGLVGLVGFGIRRRK